MNNVHLNCQWDPRTQVSLFYGAKFSTDTIDEVAYKGFTDAWVLELRRNLGTRRDIG